MRRKLLAIWCLIGMVISGMAPQGNFIVKGETGKVAAKEQEKRAQINFNSDWKFVLGDPKGAEATEYDDSGWGDIALPHSFSIPYDLNKNSFYIGDGWYRKHFIADPSTEGKRINLEFEGVFQVCTIYVNGRKAGYHEGGYTGFQVDITDYVSYDNGGENVIAIQVDNRWRPDLAPRGGDHQFSGGIYRDVVLTVTEPVHVDWYGTFVWTPALCNPAYQEGPGSVNILDSYVSDEELAENLRKRQSDVQVITDVTNESPEEKSIYVVHEVRDSGGNTVSVFQSDPETIASGKGSSLVAQSTMISDIKLWSMDDPNLYTVDTTVYADGIAVDTYESEFGFRSAQFTEDGFFLNGEKVMLDGVNAHQDHGGWCDAVTDNAFYRDVAMVKEAGFNFIRGSHYPHDPSYAAACDSLGVALWFEGGVWGIGGFKANDDAYGTTTDWTHSAYPTDPKYEEKFDQSCMDLVRDMVRVNRNHPSIIVWSMGNEAFFTSNETMEKAKQLINRMRNYCHELDPTRKAGLGGTQRNNFNDLTVSDVAGGNGDGATARYTNYTVPHMVAEYASTQEERNNSTPDLKWGSSFSPDEGSTIEVNGKRIKQYTAYKQGQYVDATGKGVYLPTGSSGMSLWCMFHHGSVGGKNLRIMGIVDYYRLPLKAWYTYREVNTGVPREDSVEGTASKMKMEARYTHEGQETLKNDGKDDAQIIVTLLNEDGKWVNDSTTVQLEVVDGPGVFPGGKTYTMEHNRQFMDGKGAIEFRSYYAGTTTIRATAVDRPELAPVTMQIVTENVIGGHDASAEPEDFMGKMLEADSSDKLPEPLLYGKNDAAFNRQTGSTSSYREGYSPLFAVDGNPDTHWEAGKTGSGEYWQISLENTYDVYRMKLDFGEKTYPYKIEVKAPSATDWMLIREYRTPEEAANRPEEETLLGQTVLDLRITFTDVPDDEYAALYECRIYGVEHKTHPYQVNSEYVSDLPHSKLEYGWGTFRKDKSIQGNPITLGDGSVYEKGLGLHADSEAVYLLNGKYTRFQAVLGIDAETGTSIQDADATYQVYATYFDEVEQADKEIQILNKTITGAETAKIDLSVDQATKLRLVTDKNAVDSNDHTDWADAKLLGALRDITPDNASLSATLGTNMTAPQAGKKFEANFRLTNKTSGKKSYRLKLEVYDSENRMVGSEEQELSLEKNASDYGNLKSMVSASDTEYYAKAYVTDENGSIQTDEIVMRGPSYVYQADPDEENELAVRRDLFALQSEMEENQIASSNLALPESGSNGSRITWSSGTPDVISDAGIVTRQPEQVEVVMTATITKGKASRVYHITYTVPAIVPDRWPNYTPETAVYTGTGMKVSTDTNFTSAKYTVSDADLGIVEGETVGSFEKIGWVGGFISGAYQSKDSRASSIQFHVEPPRAGSYTLKVIVFQSVSGNMRQSSIRINEDDSTIQNIGIGQLNQTRIAPVMDKKHNLSLATFEHVELNDGDNLVEISNKDGDAPEFVRAVFVDEKTAFEPGDVDHSGKIDVKDVTAALELASGKPGSAGDRLLADENGDGAVTAVDALLILKKATGGTGE